MLGFFWSGQKSKRVSNSFPFLKTYKFQPFNIKQNSIVWILNTVKTRCKKKNLKFIDFLFYYGKKPNNIDVRDRKSSEPHFQKLSEKSKFIIGKYALNSLDRLTKIRGQTKFINFLKYFTGN